MSNMSWQAKCGVRAKAFVPILQKASAKQNISKAEFKRFLLMAMGSADEMRVWVQYSIDLGYIDQNRWSAWNKNYTDIAKMLNGLHAKWG